MFTLKELEEETNGKIINGNFDTVISLYRCGSKTHTKNEFYVPITFKNVNREICIIDSVKNGGTGFFIEKNSNQYKEIVNEALMINPDICIIEVENVNETICKLGLKMRKQNIDKEIIAVTGSVGKTSLCNLISSILETEKKVLHDFRNANNNTREFISVDLMLFENYEIGVFELGTARPGRIEKMSQLVEPSIAVIHNIGTAHLNKFETKEGILEEKLHITDFIKDKKLLFVNANDEYLKDIQDSKNYKVIKYSTDEAYDIFEEEGKLSFKTNIYGKEVGFSLNLYGKHYINSIIVAIKIAEIYGISYENIIKGIENFKPIKGRFQLWKNEEKEITLIDDSYSSSFESVKLGLELTNKMKSKRKIAVLGKMAALGEQAPNLHEKLGKLLGNLEYDYLYLNGEFTKHIFKGALNYMEEKRIKKFKTKELLIEDLKKNIQNGDAVYIKAAGQQEFDKIVDELKDEYKLEMEQ